MGRGFPYTSRGTEQEGAVTTGWKGQGQVTKTSPHLAGPPGSLCSHLQAAQEGTGNWTDPKSINDMHRQFYSALSTSWASLAIKLQVCVFSYKMREWMCCSVAFNHLYLDIWLLIVLLPALKSIWVPKDTECWVPKRALERGQMWPQLWPQHTNLLSFLSSQLWVPYLL